VVDEADLALLDESSRQLHAKIVEIVAKESIYAGRLDREFSNSGTYYFDGLAKLALHLYKLDIPMLMSSEAGDVKRGTEVSLQRYKKLIVAAQKQSPGGLKFIAQFCSLLVSKYLSKS
jgi:hypothetical protein